MTKRFRDICLIIIKLHMFSMKLLVYRPICSLILMIKMQPTSLPAALRVAQACRYVIYSEADFEAFRPAGATRCTDGGKIWRGGGARRSPPPCQISPHRCNDKGVGPQN